jgi:hypothetical protein
MKKLFWIFFFLASTLMSPAQVVYEHISNSNIYDFLDEMANEKYIELNDVIKPYSRKMIYDKLQEVRQKEASQTISLNKRQQRELRFYWDAFVLEGNDSSLKINKHKLAIGKKGTAALALNPLGLFYKDSVFTLALQPILGITVSSNKNGTLKHTWGFVSMFGYIGKHVGFYTSVRDNDLNRVVVQPNYFVQTQGDPFKHGGEIKGVQYSEARGGLMYSWKWGAVGVVKDNVQWGVGYNGTNIQSGRTPSFAMIKLELHPVRWFSFNYYHGWLVSTIVDSSRSYWTIGTYRSVFYPKYIAANMFTFYPVRHLNISIGNSIVYSDIGVHAAYLIPFLFYKSVDHTLNNVYSGGETGQNAQMYFAISSRNIKHAHLYFDMFIDDLSFSHFKKKEEHNFISYKGGFRVSDFPVQNVAFTTEFTITNPFVYQHKIATQTYTTNEYNMGHYLRDNSKELYLALQYKPLRGLHFLLSYTQARHYDDYDYAACANSSSCNLHTVPIFENLKWQNRQILFSARYEIVSNTYVYFEYRYQNITGDASYIQKYTPEYYQGKTNTLTFGANIGF